MIKFENVVLPSADQWMVVILGCRNPMNSWEKSDSTRINQTLKSENLAPGIESLVSVPCEPYTNIGPNDLALMKKLAKAGTDHRKFMRMITVYVDITAPLYWWKEFDTYKIGTVANSCSTMHKIHAKKFEMGDFSTEHLLPVSFKCLGFTVKTLNEMRDLYLETKDKKYWWQMIQLLPSSYNQKRTVMLNYEVLVNIYKSRYNHKLDEWHDFCSLIEGLPYSELITGGIHEISVDDEKEKEK